jgi:hypothetical protein
MKRPSLMDRARRARTWALRIIVSWLMLTGLVPPRLHLEFLHWLREDLHPLHPGVPTVLREIAEAEERCRA